MAAEEEPCDICDAIPVESVADFTSTWMVKNRAITLLNITVYECKCGITPEIWAMSPLLEGILASRDAEQTWEVIGVQWVRQK